MRRFLLCFALGLIVSLAVVSVASADTGTVRTGAGFVWVRSGPSTRYSIVGRLANGSSVDILGFVNGQAVNRGNSTWYRIGDNQYVYSGLVNRQTSATPTPTPPPPTPTPAITTTVPVTDAEAARSEKWIEVILSQQRLIAREGNRVVMNVLISSGLPRYPTVRGTFRVYRKYRSAPMAGPGYYLPAVPHTMYFHRGYAIHGAYWHNKFGRPMSHGCVNMRLPDAAWLFNWAPMGTRVYIH